MRLDEDEMRLRREAIMTSAFELFCAHGIENVSMEQIAKQARVGKRTMYRYFDHKMALVTAVLVHQWGLLIDELKAAIGYYAGYSALSGLEQITLWLEAFRQMYESKAPLILFSYEAKFNVLRNNVHFSPEQMDFFTNGIRGPCVAALEKGLSDGTLAFSYEAIEVFYAIWASIRGCIALSGEFNPCQNTYQVMAETILKAIAAQS